MVIGVPSDQTASSAMVYLMTIGSSETSSMVPKSVSSQVVPSVPKYAKPPNMRSATAEL